MESICCSSQLNMMKKTMATAAAAATGLLLCFFTSASAAPNCDYHGSISGNVTLKLDHKLTSNQVIKWTHGTRVLGERKGKNRHCCDISNIKLFEDGSLELTDLTEDKGGSYRPEVFQEGKAVDGLKTINLCLHYPVPKPMLNVSCSRTATLRCYIKELPNVKYDYKWFHNGKEVAKMTKSTYSPKSQDGEIHCTVRNQVSEKKSDVITSLCSADFVFPEELFGISIWVFVGAGGGVVLLLIVLILCCCIRNRRRRRMQVKDEDEYRLRLATAGQPQNQHHNHPQHQQRQPPGHTGPRHHRPKGQHGPKGAETPSGHPRPSPRRPKQAPRQVANDEDPPPLPQPRKKGPKEPRA